MLVYWYDGIFHVDLSALASFIGAVKYCAFIGYNKIWAKTNQQIIKNQIKPSKTG